MPRKDKIQLKIIHPEEIRNYRTAANVDKNSGPRRMLPKGTNCSALYLIRQIIAVNYSKNSPATEAVNRIFTELKCFVNTT
jgi:hypothetical protein